MDLFKPDKKKDVQFSVSTERTLTVILGGNNKVLYYLGDFKKPLQGPAITGYGKDSLDKVLADDVTQQKDTSKFLIVLVKPSEKSTYKNFVSVIDLINKSGVKSYGVVDIDSADIALLKKYHNY